MNDSKFDKIFDLVAEKKPVPRSLIRDTEACGKQIERLHLFLKGRGYEPSTKSAAYIHPDNAL